jgi:hypothetical protein
MFSGEAAENSYEGENVRRDRNFLSWPVVLAIGWLVYELTAQPNLGIVFVCAKFGWEDFRAALWLRRVDPVRRRGWAMFWLYLASALWKTAIAATIAIFAGGFLAAGQKPPQPHVGGQPNDIPNWFLGAVLTAFAGFALSALAACPALWFSIRHGKKLWLNPLVHRARWENLWPPYNRGKLGTNQAGRVLLTAISVLLIPTALALGILLGTVVNRIAPWALLFVLPFLIIGGVGGIATIVMILRDFLVRRVAASGPWDCWWSNEPENEFPEPSAVRDRRLDHSPGIL